MWLALIAFFLPFLAHSDIEQLVYQILGECQSISHDASDIEGYVSGMGGSISAIRTDLADTKVYAGYLPNIDYRLGVANQDLTAIDSDILDLISDIQDLSDIAGSIDDDIGTYVFSSYAMRAAGGGYTTVDSLARWNAVLDYWLASITPSLVIGTNTLLKASLSINNKMDRLFDTNDVNSSVHYLQRIANKLDNLKVGTDANILTQMLVNASYYGFNPYGDPRDVQLFMDSGEWLDYWFFYSPLYWNRFFSLYQLPIGQAGDQDFRTIFTRPGEYESLRDFWSLFEDTGDYDARKFGWLYYDAYGTGEILRFLTNSVGVISMNNPVTRTPSNTVAFSSEYSNAIYDQSNELANKYTNTDDDYNIETNVVEQVEDPDIDRIYDDADDDGDVNQLSQVIDDLYNDFKLGFEDVVSSIKQSNGEDLILEMNLDLNLPNNVYASSQGSAIINVSQNIRQYFRGSGLRLICQFVFWFVRISYGCYIVHRLFVTLRKGLTS